MNIIKKMEQEILEKEKKLQELKQNKEILESLDIIESCSYRLMKCHTRDIIIQGVGDNEYQARSLKLSFHNDLPKELVNDFRKLLKTWKEIIKNKGEE